MFNSPILINPRYVSYLNTDPARVEQLKTDWMPKALMLSTDEVNNYSLAHLIELYPAVAAFGPNGLKYEQALTRLSAILDELVIDPYKFMDSGEWDFLPHFCTQYSTLIRWPNQEEVHDQAIKVSRNNNVNWQPGTVEHRALKRHELWRVDSYESPFYKTFNHALRNFSYITLAEDLMIGEQWERIKRNHSKFVQYWNLY
jgi:hypothetical protein